MRHLAVPMMLGLTLAGCEPTLVLIDVTGTLYTCGNPDICDTVSDAPVALYDYNTGVDTPFIETATAEDGTFELAQIPGNSVVYMVASHWEGGFVPTSFVGVTGSQDGELPDGSLFVVTEEDAQALIDEHTATHPDGDAPQLIDPDSPGNGAMVRGRFQTAVEGAESETWPGARGLSCYFEDAQGLIYPCIYTDQNGDPDWDRTTSSTDGGWAAFGIAPGEVTGVVLDAAFGEAENYVMFTSLAVEDGIGIFDTFASPF